eukprot:TRINITY_DN5635_c0_g1_i1.p2 TRINITY_DN5635_c0_g1~~TRINITY_DN5635_c0_g1_i1.p2  ORF type:complete len:151 (+),score=42.44 TRINITY_DN5635_c0_g1_i1:994-1446(+)
MQMRAKQQQNKGGDATSAVQQPTTFCRTKTQFTISVGTPLYMALEVLTEVDDGYTQAADMYSFGCMMYEIAAQELPDIIAQVRGPKAFFGMTAISEVLAEGHRLRLADSADMRRWYRQAMHACLSCVAAERPSANKLQEVFAEGLLDRTK